MKQGRPLGSKVRQNILEILYFMKIGTGYEIYKHYIEIFPKVTLRLMYYHLKKGTDIGIFKIDKMGAERGDYSWGSEAEKIYYKLTPEAKPVMDLKVKEYFDNLKEEKKLKREQGKVEL